MRYVLKSKYDYIKSLIWAKHVVISNTFIIISCFLKVFLRTVSWLYFFSFN